MFKKIFCLKRMEISLAIGLAAAVMLSSLSFGCEYKRLTQNVVRLHILANSDSEEDQAVKLVVRDAVLALNNDLFNGELNADNAKNLVTRNHIAIEKYVNKILNNNGFSYGSHAYYVEEYFDTREYDGFTLPAGKYKALKIELGKAQGHNWWCIMFPPLCLPAAETEKTKDDFCKEYKIVTDKGTVAVRFKIVEWVEQLKNRSK